MKKVVLIGLVLLWSSLQAQNIGDTVVELGKPYGVLNSTTKDYFPLGNGMVVSVKISGVSGSIQKYNAISMSEVGRKVYQDFPKYAKGIKMVELGSNLFVIYEAYNKKLKTFVLYSREVLADKIELGRELILVAPSRLVDASKMAKLDDLGKAWMPADYLQKFDVSNSVDKTKLLIRYRLNSINKKDKNNFDDLGFFVFDQSLNKVWGKEIRLKNTEAEIDNLESIVDNDGEVFMLIEVEKTKSLKMLKISANNMEDFPLKLSYKKDLTFEKVDFKESPFGNFIVVAYYGSGKEPAIEGGISIVKSLNVKGALLFEVNKVGEIVLENDIEFPFELIMESVSAQEVDSLKEREKNDNAGILDLRMRNFKIFDDGSILLVGEVCFREKNNRSKDNLIYTHYGNLLLTKINKNGVLLWHKKLPKKQKGSDLGELGFQFSKEENAYYFFFLDNVKNKSEVLKGSPEEYYYYGRGIMMAYKVSDSDGAIKKFVLFDTVNVEGKKLYQLNMDRIVRASKNVFLLEAYVKEKMDNMVKIDFN